MMQAIILEIPLDGAKMINDPKRVAGAATRAPISHHRPTRHMVAKFGLVRLAPTTRVFHISKGRRPIERLLMTALALASSLFAATTALKRPPLDENFADCLLSRAFNSLCLGVQGDLDAVAVADCAEKIEGCGFLSSAVRDCVGTALRGVLDGSMPVALGREIVFAAAAGHSHFMASKMLRAMGADGLSDIADALAPLAPQEKAH